MIKISKGIFYLLSTLLFLAFSSSQANNKVMKDKIESNIREKIARSIGGIITKDQYIIDIKIDHTTIEPPKPKEVKFNDTDKAKSEEDYILFNKLGIEVPVDAQLDELKETPVEAREELKEILVSILLDKELKQNKSDSVKKVLEAINFNLQVKPSFKFEEIDFSREKVIVKKPTIIDHLKDFNIPLGLFGSSFMLGLLLVVGLSKMSKSVVEASNIGATSISDAVTASAENAAAEGGAGGSGSEADLSSASVSTNSNSSAMDGDLKVITDEDIKSSINRFKDGFKENPISISALVKNWLKLMPKGAREALIILAKELSSEDLMDLFKQLKIEERKDWQKVIQSSTGTEDMVAGTNFLDSQILQDIIVPNDLIDDVTKSILAGMAPVNIAKLVNENQNVGPLLMNTLSSTFIIQMMEFVDADAIETLTTNAAGTTEEDLKAQAPDLKQLLENFDQGIIKVPFIDKVGEIIPQVDYEKEEFFFKALGKSGDKNLIFETVRDNLPFSLFEKLPDNILKNMLSSVPKDSFINFLVCMDDGKRNLYLNARAAEGSKARELIQIDLDTIVKNDIETAKIRKKSKIIIGSFLNSIRKVIRSSPGLADEMEPQIYSWLSENIEGDWSESTETLSEAA